MEHLASASWLTTTKGRLPMPKYKVYAIVTEEWATEVDAEDKDHAEELGYANFGYSEGDLDWKRTPWDGDFSIHEVIEKNENNQKGEK